MWFVYILSCQDGSFYTGVTNDLEKRLKAHFAGKGGRYTRSHPPQKLVYREECATRSEALKREAQIKSLSQTKKEFLVKTGCARCGLCCRLFLINLSESEYRSGQYQTQFEEFGLMTDFKKAVSCGANFLKQKEDGSCVYLKRGKCSIHQIRPQVCREFVCNSKEARFKGMIEQIKTRRGLV